MGAGGGLSILSGGEDCVSDYFSIRSGIKVCTGVAMFDQSRSYHSTWDTPHHLTPK